MTTNAEDKTNATGQEAQADRLVRCVEDCGAVLFHDAVGDAWAHVPMGGHMETLKCGSKSCRRWLSRLFWESENKALNSQAIQSALSVIEAKARFDGEQHALHNRVAWHDDAIWYDLGDRAWRAVRIDATGWRVVASPPILFRRYSHQQTQVEPQRGGDLRRLLDFVNLADGGRRLLLLVYLVSCFVPDIPHPIPVLYGPQGASKTTLFRMLRRLTDPSLTETLTFPKGIVEFVQQLSHHWAPYYDNITHIPGEMSDALCRATTGAGFSKRVLFTDDDDVIYAFRRCCGLNGINIAAHKPDLLDRCLLFALEPIAPNSRKPEKAIWEAFRSVQGHLIGAVFAALSRAMAIRPSIQLDGLPRMADFALWGSAISQSLGYSEQEFLDALEMNFEDRNREVIEGNPVASLISSFMAEQSRWEGTASDLLEELEKLAPGQGVNTKDRFWPRRANTLTRRLNEVRPNLAATGIEVDTRVRTASGRSVTIRKIEIGTATQPALVALDDDTRDDGSIPSRVPSHQEDGQERQNDDSDDDDGISGTCGSPTDLEAAAGGVESSETIVTTVTIVADPGNSTLLDDGMDDDPPSIAGDLTCDQCDGDRFWRSAHDQVLCQGCGKPAGSTAP